MRFIFALVFLFGIGIAGFAAYMAMQQFKQLQAENRVLRQKASKVVETVPVLLATRELRYGQDLKPGDAEEVLFPKDAIPPNSFTSIEELFGAEDEEPREIVRTMEPGEVILQSKVTKFGQPATVASRLKKGMRAFTINVDVTTGVSGFLQPGDEVDVYWTGNIQGQQTTKLLLEKVELIAIDQIADADLAQPTVARTVTVEVSPIVVASLAQARTSGRLSLALRGEKRKCVTRIRQGTQVQVVQVPCSD